MRFSIFKQSHYTCVCEGGFCHVMALVFFLRNAPNRWISFLVTFSFHKTSHVLLLEMPPPSSTVRNLRNAPFFYLENQMGEWDISRFLNVEKWGFSWENHVVNLKREKNRKWMCWIFWHFKEKCNAVTWQNAHSHAFWGISWYFWPKRSLESNR